MDKRHPESLTDLTNNAKGSLRFLLDNLTKIKHIDQIVKQKMAPELRTHCRVINFRDNQLIIATNSAAWATRIKFTLPELVSNLRSDGFAGLTNIELIIAQSHTNQTLL